MDKIKWVTNLQPGDRVSTGYLTDAELQAKLKGVFLDTGEREATVEYVMTNVCSQSGVKVKLKEFISPLDAFWINPVS